MYKNDSVYKILLKYNFDLFRGDKGITEYMREHCKQFYNDVMNAADGENPLLGEKFVALLKENSAFLKEICREIPEILEVYDQGFLGEVYNKSRSLFEKVMPYYIARFSWRRNNGCFYRIRQGDFRIKDSSESKKQKAELFHIKKELRNRIGAYRYSVAGYPCLYLASDRELAWFECGMPQKFSYCQMIIDEEGANALKLIDFSNRPIDFLTNVTVWIQNARRRGETDEQEVYQILLRYIITYPLAAACSVKVKDRDSKFVEEYIFPQLFMQWIRERDDIDGVRYKSSLNTNLVQGMGAINVALPVKQYREDGLDLNLTEKIVVSDIEYLDVNEDFTKYKEVLNEIQEYKNELYSYITETPYCGEYLLELIDICECVIKTYNALMEGNYRNPDLLFNQVNVLWDYTSLLYKSREGKIQEVKEQGAKYEIIDINETEIQEHFEKFHILMGKILHKHLAFDLSFKTLTNFEKI